MAFNRVAHQGKMLLRGSRLAQNIASLTRELKRFKRNVRVNLARQCEMLHCKKKLAEASSSALLQRVRGARGLLRGSAARAAVVGRAAFKLQSVYGRTALHG